MNTVNVLADTPFKGNKGSYKGFGPDGAMNTVYSVMFNGDVVGDCETGSDGFMEIMLMIPGVGFLKLKRYPDQLQADLSLFSSKKDG